MANIITTYILWLFFGWTGLHHVYLGRLNQAIVWFATLGGGCGLGWFRDFWRIPDYVEWNNLEKSTQIKYLTRISKNPRSRCSYFRFAGMVIMGFIVSTSLGTLVPDFKEMSKTDPVKYYLLKYIFVALLMFGNALGVYLVANIGEFQCSKYYPCISSICITFWTLDKNPNMGVACFLTAVITWYKGLQWRSLTLTQEENLKPKRKMCKNISIYVLVCAVWLSVLTSGFYFNAVITGKDGEKIPVREAVNNFFKSDAWKRTKESLYHLFNIYRHAGAGRAWSDAMGLFDFSGEVNAYKVLSLSHRASQDEISKRCRKLSAEHHPDRFKTQTEKDRAQDKFIEIQDACRSLSSLHSRRSKNNKMSTEDNDN